MEAELVEIRDAARRALAGSCALEELRAADVVPDALVERIWAAAVTAGWPALMPAEEAGGLDLGLTVAVVVAEEIGRALAPGTWGTTLALAPLLDLEPATAEALAAGEIRVALAVCEPDGDRLVGLVDHARTATHHLVVEARPEVGLRVRLIATGEALEIVDRQPLDPTTPLARVVHATTGGVELRATPRAFDALRCFVAAEMIGAAKAAFALALEHARTRMQFGVAIGSFQSIKHRLADVAIATDSATLAIEHAARRWDERMPDAALDVAVAFDLAERAAREACNAAIQVHGAIGVSWEHDLHLQLKRTRSLSALMRHRAIPRANVADHLSEAIRMTG